MLRRRAQLDERRLMRPRAVALMRREPISGVLPVQLSHQLVTCLLGDDRRRRDHSRRSIATLRRPALPGAATPTNTRLDNVEAHAIAGPDSRHAQPTHRHVTHIEAALADALMRADLTGRDPVDEQRDVGRTHVAPRLATRVASRWLRHPWISTMRPSRTVSTWKNRPASWRESSCIVQRPPTTTRSPIWSTCSSANAFVPGRCLPLVTWSWRFFLASSGPWQLGACFHHRCPRARPRQSTSASSSETTGSTSPRFIAASASAMPGRMSAMSRVSLTGSRARKETRLARACRRG
jgi:hypothetical protein